MAKVSRGTVEMLTSYQGFDANTMTCNLIKRKVCYVKTMLRTLT